MAWPSCAHRLRLSSERNCHDPTAEEPMTTRRQLMNFSALARPLTAMFAALSVLSSVPTFAAQIHGQVTGGGAPIVGSTVTLWAASASVPRQLTQSRTDSDGRFVLSADS